MSKIYTFTFMILEPNFRTIISHIEVMGLMRETVPKFPPRCGIFVYIRYTARSVSKIFYIGVMNSKELVNYKREIQILCLFTDVLKSIH